MNWHNVVTVYRKELRDSLRDRRTLLSTIVVPTLIMPGIVLSAGLISYKVVNKAREETPTVMLLGGADFDGLRAICAIEFVIAATWLVIFVTPLIVQIALVR